MTEKRTIEQHISEDHGILEDPNISPQRRRHIEDEPLILRDTLRNIRKILKQATIMIQQILKCFVMKNLGRLSVSCMRINN